MRVLAFATPMVGHLNPMIPLLGALRAAAHEVSVAVPEGFAGHVTARGFPVHTMADVSLRACMSLDRAGREVPDPIDETERVDRSGRGWGRLAAAQVDECGDLLRWWRPDAVIADPVHYAASITASAHRVPWVEHGWGIWPETGFAEAATSELQPELGSHGRTALPDPQSSLDVCPGSFQRSRERSLPMRYVPFGGAARRPGWLDEPRDRPLVCITFGSLLPSFPSSPVHALLDGLLRMLPRIGCDVVVAIPPEHGAQLPREAGVLDIGWLPLDVVLPRCAAIVHYAGSGTAMSALVAGVPQVLVNIPMADAPGTAAVLRGAGLAHVVDGTQVEAEAVLEACRAALSDAELRRKAAEISEVLRAQPPPAEHAQRFAEIVSGRLRVSAL